MAHDRYKVQDDPLRPPDWRWRRIQTLATVSPFTNRFPRINANDDNYIRRGRGFLLLYNQIKNKIAYNEDVGRDLLKLKSHYYDIYSAYELFIADRAGRWALEGLILGGADARKIATSLGCSDVVVLAYEALFYDLRTRLNNELFIIDVALSPLYAGGAGNVTINVLWRGIGFWFGADALLAYIRVGKYENQLRELLYNLMISQQHRNVIRALFTRAINQYTAHDIIQEHIDTGQLELAKRKLLDEDSLPGNNSDMSAEKLAEKGAKYLIDAIKITDGLIQYNDFSTSSSSALPDDVKKENESKVANTTPNTDVSDGNLLGRKPSKQIDELVVVDPTLPTGGIDAQERIRQENEKKREVLERLKALRKQK